MNRFVTFFFPYGLCIVLVITLGVAAGCTTREKVQSVSGVEMATVGSVSVDSQGRTVEQQNLTERIKRDNELGSIKFLYVISTWTGDVLIQSTVRGKVTSTSKRLTPRNIGTDGTEHTSYLPTINVGGRNYTVNELPNEDGTYGSSTDSIFWFTPDGRYHQTTIAGGAIVHVSDQPLTVKKAIINIESK